MKKILMIVTALVFGAGVSFAYDEGPVTNGGTIQGHVKFSGTAPKLEAIKVQKNMDFCGNSVPAEGLQVGKDGGVKFAIGYLDKVTKGKAIDRATQTLFAEAKCMFKPHVIAVVKGTDIAINNEDTILHNINISVDGIQRFNKGQPKQNQLLVAKLRQTGVADVTCDSHTHMKSWMLILDHPYFAISDETGTFNIKDVPAGKYTLKVWHESWKVTSHDDDGRPIYGAPILLSQDVEVKAGDTAHAKFEIKP
jgi:plastocyanin